MKSTFSVNIVNSVYSFQFIYLVYVYLLFGALMGFEAKCVCSKHSTWHHGDISAASLRIASPEELEFCGVDTSKNKTRKRKICLPCRERIALELKCRRYEEVNFNQLVPSSVPTLEETLMCHEENVSSSVESVEYPDPVDIESMENCPLSSKAIETSSKSVQVPEIPRRPYKEAELRTQQTMRSKTIDSLTSLADKYVHFNESDVPMFICDLVRSGKWQASFGTESAASNSAMSHGENSFLSRLAPEYKACKDKEANKAIRKNATSQKQKVLIGDTLRKSRISLNGNTPEIFSSRVDAAKQLGRLRCYADEKRRLLSIVAMDYPYSVLQKYFQCSSKTVTAAKVHCILFGHGGVPVEKFKFTRQCVSPQVLEELTEFLHRDDVSRASSCRSVLVDGEEMAVRYWQDTVKGLINQYLLEFPNGVKRTYIYTHLPTNFRMNTMLAGLCNICDDFGHSNFDELCTFIKELCSHSPGLNGSALVKDVRRYQTFVKTKFSKLSQRHSSCLELCQSHAFSSCPEEHQAVCTDISPIYNVYSSVLESVDGISDQSVKSDLTARLQELFKVHTDYLGHLLCTKHQGDYYKFILKNLKPGECVMVIDYKMKLELGKRVREIQRDWYGKWGISLHGCYVVAQVDENQRSSEVFDLWSEDTKQDAFFTQSALDVCFSWLERVFPGYSVYLFSDNGPHYHNTAVLCYLSEVNEVFNVRLQQYNNFEAGEGKTALDTHFAHISHKIVRYVRLGNDLETGEELGDLVQSMKNVSCFKLNIDRSKAPKKMGTLKDISLFGSFAFPMDGEYASGLVAQSLAGVGKMVKKTKVQVKKLASRESCLAGVTGSSISSELPEPLERHLAVSIQPQDVYTIRFINHAPETVLAPTLDNVPQPSSFPSPPSGFALKKNSGKKTVFSLAQKEIMMLFYNRQVTSGMQADPKDVIACMRERGVEVLKEQQIRSWWSMYHQKRERSLNSLTNDACNPTSQQHPVQPPSVSAPTTPASQQPSVATMCASQQPSGHAAPVPAPTSPASQQPSAHATPLMATTAPGNQQHSGHAAPVPALTTPASQQPSGHTTQGMAATMPASQQPSGHTAPVPAHTTPASQQPSGHAAPVPAHTTPASQQPCTTDYWSHCSWNCRYYTMEFSS